MKAAVLAEAPNRTVALTTALLGAGGYGKTTLANALCRDDDVRFEFSDGILRVEIGKERNDVTGLVADLIEKLDPDGKRPGFTDVVTASEHLGELLGESRILLVIDDVWREAQLKPFLRGGPNCVRLVTTRLPGVLPAGSVSVAIDEMRAAEAASVMSAHLPGADQPTSALRLAALAKRLGFWAQMLAIANGWLRERVARGEPLPDAIAKFERRLARDGPFVFNPRNETQRNKAIRLCIEASVQDLAVDEASRFAELAVLPEDEDVPLAVIEALWAQTGRLDEDDADDLVMRLGGLSLLQSLDLGRRTLRLHDNMLWYLRDRLGAEGLKAAHAAMVRAIRAKCAGVWNKLPFDQTYGWRFLILHLRGAEQDRTADDLLSDYAWIKAKLHATDARSLYGSYFPESADPDVRRIGRAIGLSLPTLMKDRRELACQLFGRLGDTGLPCASAARLDPDCRPRPRWPGLTPPGAERLSLRGHEDCGAERRVLARRRPHRHRLRRPHRPHLGRRHRRRDRRPARARGWGEERRVLARRRPHRHRLRATAPPASGTPPPAPRSPPCAGTRIGCRAPRSRPTAPASSPPPTTGTARIWDAATGAEIAALRGHDNQVTERRVLARRRPHRHRLLRPHRPHLGRRHRRRDRRPARAREWGAERRVLARRRPHRHRLRRPHRPHLGRRHRRRDRRSARARERGGERRVLARRRPHRHRLLRPHRPHLGRRHRRRDRRPARA